MIVPNLLTKSQHVLLNVETQNLNLRIVKFVMTATEIMEMDAHQLVQWNQAGNAQVLRMSSLFVIEDVETVN